MGYSKKARTNSILMCDDVTLAVGCQRRIQTGLKLNLRVTWVGVNVKNMTERASPSKADLFWFSCLPRCVCRLVCKGSMKHETPDISPRAWTFLLNGMDSRTAEALSKMTKCKVMLLELDIDIEMMFYYRARTHTYISSVQPQTEKSYLQYLPRID